MNWFDIAIAVISVYCIITGFRTGLVRQLAKLAGLIIGAILSGKLSPLIIPYIETIKEIPPSVVSPLAYILVFVAILIGFYFVGTTLEGILKKVKLNKINKLAGVVLCLAKWMIAISIILNLLVEFDSKFQVITPQIKENSITYPYIKSIAPRLIPFFEISLDSIESLNKE